MAGYEETDRHNLPEVLLKAGNCIPCAVALGLDAVADTRQKLGRRTRTNKDAEARRARSYRSVAEALGCAIAPSQSAALGQGKWLTHMPTTSGAHCVLLDVDSEGDCKLHMENLSLIHI